MRSVAPPGAGTGERLVCELDLGARDVSGGDVGADVEQIGEDPAGTAARVQHSVAGLDVAAEHKAMDLVDDAEPGVRFEAQPLLHADVVVEAARMELGAAWHVFWLHCVALRIASPSLRAATCYRLAERCRSRLEWRDTDTR